MKGMPKMPTIQGKKPPVKTRKGKPMGKMVITVGKPMGGGGHSGHGM